MTDLEELYSQAVEIQDIAKQEQAFIQIIQNKDALVNDDNLKAKELSFYGLADLYCSNNKAEQVQQLILNQNEVLVQLPGAKSAKILKNLVDKVSKVKNTINIQIELSQYVIDWCTKQERTHLRHKQQIKLSSLYLEVKKFQQAIALITDLLVEIRKADDKHLLVEAQLIESRIYFALQNFSKAKASLTSARASANQVYCEPQLQADLDLQSGIIFAQDKDYKTSYSYYYEAFEALHNLKDDKSVHVLKYMILCKIMSRKYDDVAQLIGGKYGIAYQGPHLDAVQAISKANQKQSLVQFQKVLQEHKEYLDNDYNIQNITNTLYDQLLEENLFRIIEPYSKVQIQHIAQKINLDQQLVQNKLSELILDKKIEGTLDQGNGCLILFSDLKCDSTYNNALDLMKSMSSVVDKLFERAKQIKA